MKYFYITIFLLILLTNPAYAQTPNIHLINPIGVDMKLGLTREGQFSIEWNTANSIQINRIRILSDIDSLSFTFQGELPDKIILFAEDDGFTIRDVKFTVSAPKTECTQIITTNCAEKKRYDVLVEIQFFHLNALFLDTIIIQIDLSKSCIATFPSFRK